MQFPHYIINPTLFHCQPSLFPINFYTRLLCVARDPQFWSHCYRRVGTWRDASKLDRHCRMYVKPVYACWMEFCEQTETVKQSCHELTSHIYRTKLVSEV